MGILDKLFKNRTEEFSFSRFPYPENVSKCLVDNLKKGILFEGNNHFIPWTKTYTDLSNENIEIDKQGDRTIFKFGIQKVLNGLELNLTSMKWLDTKSKVSFASIESNLGQDEQGRTEAIRIKDHLVNLFGEPNETNEEEEWEMSLCWRFDNVEISIVGWSHFAMKYDIKIGLVNDPNWAFMKK
tara:strand:+ start:949 stop:1500 length:552 start_codon:yes stop_codon:yes gene_type:complete